VYWQDRSRLVDILLESLHEPAIAEVEAAWGGEIERRLDEHDRGEINSIDADEVFAKARSIAR
jgi:putative addiction module component (TIGR02574 family)